MEPSTTTTHEIIGDRNLAERRLEALVNAIRVHERAQWRKPYPRRSDDLRLYRRVRRILGEDA